MAAPLRKTWAVKNYCSLQQRHLKRILKLCHMIETNSFATKSEIRIPVGQRAIDISTGDFAKFADGSAVAKQGDTTVLVTAVSKTKASPSTFLPLTVDYRQKAASAGRIPTNFLRREIGASEKEILTGRVIDRSLRPLFPKGYNFETQVICNLLAVDGENDPDILSINAASAALVLSDIPFDGPVGAVRVGYVNNKLVINPSRQEQQISPLNLIITGCRGKKVVMIEAHANNFDQELFKSAIEEGIKEVETIIDKISGFGSTLGKPKRSFEIKPDPPDDITAVIEKLTEGELTKIFQDTSHDKFSRDNAVRSLKSSVCTNLLKLFPDKVKNDDLIPFYEAYDAYVKKIFRKLVLTTDKRCDGRNMTQLRPINCKVDLFKPLHGSAMFQRGQTQVVCTVTLDSLDSAAKVDTISQIISGMKEKNFMLHYEFPPYATNEIAKTGSTTRRELGHGALAEKGLRAIIPNNYPFTIRLTSEVLESNGSSSMASICGGSMALMDAGIPVTHPAAGVALGLITDTETDGNLQYKILTDILGIEDYMGDMDFKIAGTSKGVTALQADVKLPGVPLEIVMKSIDQSEEAKNQILKIMSETISQPRQEKKDNFPVVEDYEVSPGKRSKFVGLGGINLKKLQSETGVRISPIDESTFQIFAYNKEAMGEAKRMIEDFMMEEPIPQLEYGAIYTGKITEIENNGVWIQIHPKLEPMFLHKTQLDTRKVFHASVLGFEVGKEISVKYYGRDPNSGQPRLSRKVLLTPLGKASFLKSTRPPSE